MRSVTNLLKNRKLWKKYCSRRRERSHISRVERFGRILLRRMGWSRTYQNRVWKPPSKIMYARNGTRCPILIAPYTECTFHGTASREGKLARKRDTEDLRRTRKEISNRRCQRYVVPTPPNVPKRNNRLGLSGVKAWTGLLQQPRKITFCECQQPDDVPLFSVSRHYLWQIRHLQSAIPSSLPDTRAKSLLFKTEWN